MTLMTVSAHCGCGNNTRITTENPVEVRNALNAVRGHCTETGHSCEVNVKFEKHDDRH